MKFSQKFIKASDIPCDFDNHVPAPYFRKKFNLDFKPESSEITICGLGFYELYINGTNVTKGPLAPYISNTDDICYYDNYDISTLLKEGENVIAVILGNGFRNAFGGFLWNFDKSEHRGVPTVALCVEASNGTNRFELEADESFKTHPSPITFDDLRMGCRYDARLETDGWNLVDFDDTAWDNAMPETKPRGKARLCPAEPIVITKELAPISIMHFDTLAFSYKSNKVNSEPYESAVANDVYLYDFGINTAGVTRLRIKNAKKGQKITVRHGEYFKDNIFSMNTVSFNRPGVIDKYIEYGQTDVYICKGGDEEFIPKFKYDGFRYAYVEGLTAEQATDDAVMTLVMNSDLSERADFECSDDTINKLQECTKLSDLGNFYYFPTDCPHREKNGWTGDAAASAEHMLLNFTAENSLKEWLANIRAAQRIDGALPGIVPTGGWGFEWGSGPAWDCVCVMLPYYIYKFTGDKSVIEENLSMIMRYLCYAYGKRDEKGLVHFGLGDWVDPFPVNENPRSPLEVTDSVTLYDLAKKASVLFNEIGRLNESRYAQAVADDMRQSIRAELIDFNTLTVAGDCQTSQAFSLAAGIFNDDEYEKASNRLVEIIHRDGDVNACGLIGLRHIFHVLSAIGQSELAYRMITSESRSCYGYWLKNGATTLYESFCDISDSFGDSKNHHFLGDISSWFIQELAGLKPNPTATDITEFEISPKFIAQLDFAKASFNSAFGQIKGEWNKKAPDCIELTVVAPEGVHGNIILSDGFTFNDGTSKKEILPKTTTYTCKK